MFIIIVFWLGSLFLSCPLYFFHTYASLLTAFVCFFIWFHFFCPYRQEFGKTLVHEFPIAYSHTKQYLIFPRNDMIEMVDESPVKNWL